DDPAGRPGAQLDPADAIPIQEIEVVVGLLEQIERRVLEPGARSGIDCGVVAVQLHGRWICVRGVTGIVRRTVPPAVRLAQQAVTCQTVRDRKHAGKPPVPVRYRALEPDEGGGHRTRVSGLDPRSTRVRLWSRSGLIATIGAPSRRGRVRWRGAGSTRCRRGR